LIWLLDSKKHKKNRRAMCASVLCYNISVMSIDFNQLLTSLGLSPLETRVYLASYELGPTSVQEIAKRARLSRTAAYEAIGLLQERGLVSTHTREKKRYFVAEEPERAVRYFKDTILNMQHRLEDLALVIPELRMRSGGERPTVRFYEGREALFSIFDDLSRVNPKQFDEVSNLDDIYDHLDVEYLDGVRRALNPEKVHTRILHKGKLRRTGRSAVEFCELPDSINDFHGDIWIYGNRVVFVAFVGKIMAVVIESQSFADTARALFDAAWKMCKR